MSLASLRARLIAPTWRSLQDTLLNGELIGPRHKTSSLNWSYNPFTIQIAKWLESNSLVDAIDLVQIYKSNPLPLTEVVVKAADQVIREVSEESMPFVHQSAESILNGKTPVSEGNRINTSAFLIANRIEELRDNVRKSRMALHSNPRSAIRYLDLARAHMSLGHREQAIKEIQDAVNLAPHNRYVTRCAVKGMLHVGEEAEAWRILKKNQYHTLDPWLLSASIAIDLVRKSTRTDIKRVRGILCDTSFNEKSLSELASSLATLENNHSTARMKVVKKLIVKSLKDPIDNSLAQAQWLNYDNGLGLYVPPASSRFSYEYLTFKLQNEGDYQGALNQAYGWMIDKPFSRRAALECSNIITKYSKDYNQAIEVLKIGLMANPDAEDLLNNIAYLYLKSGQTEEASRVLQKVINIKDTITDTNAIICLNATFGMYAFRIGRYDVGEWYYERAIEEAEKKNKAEYAESAKINFFNEKYMAGLLSKEQFETLFRQLNVFDPDNKLMMEDMAREAGIQITGNNILWA